MDSESWYLLKIMSSLIGLLADQCEPHVHSVICTRWVSVGPSLFHGTGSLNTTTWKEGGKKSHDDVLSGFWTWDPRILISLQDGGQFKMDNTDLLFGSSGYTEPISTANPRVNMLVNN